MVKKLLLVMFIILATSCSAYVSSDIETISKCSCEKVVDSFVITNDADFAVEYRMTNDGSGSGYAKLDHRRVIIPAKTSFVFTNTYVGDCRVYGDYVTYTTIKDTLGGIRQFKKDVHISQCDNLYVTARGMNSICHGENLTFEIDIKNTGDFTDIVTVDFLGYDDYALSESSFNITKDDTQKIFLNINTNNDFDYYETTLVVKSVASKNVVEFPINFQIENCFDIDFEIGEIQKCSNGDCKNFVGKMCLGDYRIPIQIKNWGTRDQEFGIAVGSSNLEVESNNEIELEAGEKTEFDIQIETMEAGDASLTVFIGKKNKTVDLKFASDYDCFKPSLLANKITIINGSKYFSFNLRNDGLTETYYSVEEFSDIIEVSESFMLKPHETQNVLVKVNELNIGKHFDAIYVYSNGVEYKEDITINVIQDYSKILKENYVFIILVLAVLLVFYIIFSIERKN